MNSTPKAAPSPVELSLTLAEATVSIITAVHLTLFRLWLGSLHGTTRPSTLKLVISRNQSGLNGLGVGPASCAKLHIVNTQAD